MARGQVPTLPPITRTLDYGALVRKAWGDQFHVPDIAYRFSNNRTFNDPAPNGGPYGTNTA
jgi:hypothetical protein